MLYRTCIIGLVATSAALADTVTIDFEDLDQSTIYSGDSWAGGNTTKLSTQFIADGIDFGGQGSGVNHDNLFFGSILPGDGQRVSLLNGRRADGVDVLVPVMTFTAQGGTWSNFEMRVLTLAMIEARAYDAGGSLLETLSLDTGTTWMDFMFAIDGIARIEFEGTGADLLIDQIRFTNSVVIPLPGAGGLALVGLSMCAPRRRRMASNPATPPQRPANAAAH